MENVKKYNFLEIMLLVKNKNIEEPKKKKNLIKKGTLPHFKFQIFAKMFNIKKFDIKIAEKKS